jgi:hypothetical protein
MFWSCCSAINVPVHPIGDLACLSIDLLDLFCATVAMDAAQSFSAINPE